MFTLFYIYLKSRLIIFHRTILTFNYLMNTAWSASSSEVCRRVNITNNRQLCSNLYLLYHDLTEVYLNTKESYGNFFRFPLMSLIFVPSLFLLYTILQNGYSYFILFCGKLHYHRRYICGCVPQENLNSTKFKNHCIMYITRIGSMRFKLHSTIGYTILYTDITFDCTYFTVDVSLSSFVFDFIKLFVFAIIQ